MKNLIRYFKDSDADEVSTLVCRNLREVNSKDYPPNIIEKITEGFTSDKIQHFARQREMFVMENEGKIVGTASLVRDTKTEDEQYACLTLFVLPEWHGKGIGKQLMNRIEESAKCKGSKVLQVPASLTSISFYRKLDYTKNKARPFDPEDGYVWMIKSLNKIDARNQTHPTPVSRRSAPHYKWAGICDGWPLITGKDLSVVEELMPPNTSETRHYHETARQFFYVLTGEAILEIEGEEFKICGGEGLEVAPGKKHKIMNRTLMDVSFLAISAPTTKDDRINVD